MYIDSETYSCSRKNFNSVDVYDKRTILLVGSGRKDENQLKHLSIKERGKSKKYPHFTVTREGYVYQHFDPSYSGEYTGDNFIDKNTIVISLSNMGYLFYHADHGDECYYNWVNEICETELVYNKKWREREYWEKYSDEQHSSVVDLCKYLITNYGIEKKCLGHNVYDTSARFYKGIITRSNIDNDYCDLNPSFNFKRLISEIET